MTARADLRRDGLAPETSEEARERLQHGREIFEHNREIVSRWSRGQLLDVLSSCHVRFLKAKPTDGKKKLCKLALQVIRGKLPVPDRAE